MRQCTALPLGTKCWVPGLPQPFIRRPRLEQLLDDEARRAVTLVSAAPGSGKTTLLAGWFHGRLAGSGAWLTLDPRDNDSGRLARGFLGTLVSVGMLPGHFAQTTRPDTTTIDAAFQELAGDARHVLVLDDTHELTSPHALATLAHIVERAPANLDVVVAARADPPLGLGRLRVSNRLHEIRGADLAFTLNEASELLAADGLHLGEDEVRLLWNRTEGWVAGLRLATYSLERGQDPQRFLADVGTDEAGVSDYLLHEVLLRQDEKVQDFLLRTSIVDRLTPELAMVLSEDPAAAERLAELEHRGVFLVRLDGAGWFRYHALLADLLRARLRQHDPGLATDLQRRAASWHAARGMTFEAAEFARAAGDWDLLSQLLGRRWLEAVLAGEDVPSDLLDDVPPSVVATTPMLALLATADACAAHDATAARRYRRALADAGLTARHSSSESVPLDVAAAVVDVLHGCAFGGNARAEAAGRWLHRSRAVDSRTACFMALRQADLRLDVGDVRGAQHELEPLGAVGEPHGLVLEGQALLALLHAVTGRLRLATVLAAEVQSSRDAPIRAHYLAQLAVQLCSAQRGETPGQVTDISGTGSPFGSRSLRAADRAMRKWFEGGSPVVGLDGPTSRHSFAGHALVALGVLEVLDNAGSLVTLGGPAEAAVRRAREALASQAHGAVIAAVEPWLRPGAPPIHPRTHIEAATMTAVASQAQGDRIAASNALRTAIALAAADGLVAPLLVHGAMLKDALGILASELWPHQQLALQLTDAVRRMQPSVFDDPLTEREQVVLRYLPTLMSNAEIAQSMHLSVNTVKTHLKALYRKLNVDRRRDAVVRARQLELF